MLDNVDAALESAISSHEAGDLLVIAGEKYLEILKAEIQVIQMLITTLGCFVLNWVSLLWVSGF